MNENLESEFMQKGCKSRKDAAIASQVYLELCEVKKYWDVEYFYNATLHKIYFIAKKRTLEEPSVFVPIAVSEIISFLELQKLFKLDDKLKKQAIYIVIVNADSTCIYYQIFDGLGDPPADSSKTIKDDHSQKLDAELRKNRKILQQAALFGIPVTLPKKPKIEKASSSST